MEFCSKYELKFIASSPGTEQRHQWHGYIFLEMSHLSTTEVFKYYKLNTEATFKRNDRWSEETSTHPLSCSHHLSISKVHLTCNFSYGSLSHPLLQLWQFISPAASVMVVYLTCCFSYGSLPAASVMVVYLTCCFSYGSLSHLLLQL